MEVIKFFLLIVLFASILLMGCVSVPDIKSPKEFFENCDGCDKITYMPTVTHITEHKYKSSAAKDWGGKRGYSWNFDQLRIGEEAPDVRASLVIFVPYQVMLIFK